MPALVAEQRAEHVRAFYDHLVARGKQPIVVVVAVMRKLLYCISGMLKHGQDVVGERFYRIAKKPAARVAGSILVRWDEKPGRRRALRGTDGRPWKCLVQPVPQARVPGTRRL